MIRKMIQLKEFSNGNPNWNYLLIKLFKKIQSQIDYLISKTTSKKMY